MSMFAYALSKRDFKFRGAFTFLLFFTTLFSGGLVPSYLVNTQLLHLGNTIWIYIFPSLISAWNVIVIRTFFQGLPGELYESARLDGASETRICFQIVLPLSTPALASVGFLAFINHWNGWSTSQIYIRNPALYSLQYLLKIILDSEEYMRQLINEGLASSAEGEAALENLESMRVPNYQQAANQYYWITPKEYLTGSGYTVAQIEEIFYGEDSTVADKYDFFEAYTQAVREYTGLDTKWASNMTDRKICVNPSNEMSLISWSDVIFWDEDANCLAYVNTMPEMLEGYARSAECYQTGYIHPDVATIKGSDFSGMNFLNDESYAYGFAQAVGDAAFESAQLTAAYGLEMVAIPTFDYCFISNAWGAGGMAISATCEHPEEAMSAIALLENSKYKDFYNTLCFGLEGVHYVKTGDNAIETLEFSGSQGNAECTYTVYKWTVGNTFNAWLNQSASAELNDYILHWINEGEQTVYSPLMGLTFKTAEIQTEISQVAAVTGEYYATLAKGIKGADWAAYYEEYAAKLEAAGLSTILETLNQQAADFLAAKN